MSDEQVYLKSLQEEIKRQGRRWKAGRTRFTKKPPEMFRRSLGLVSPDEKSRSAMRARIARAKKMYIYPSSFDWRGYDGKDWTTHIRDQGGCGSCVAFGVVLLWKGLTGLCIVE